MKCLYCTSLQGKAESTTLSWILRRRWTGSLQSPHLKFRLGGIGLTNGAMGLHSLSVGSGHIIGVSLS